MKYNDLQVSANRNKKRVGRGIAAGQGKTAGRGTKGQNARTGKKLRVMFQVPKARGFKSLRTPAQVVYMDHLNTFDGKTVDNALLFTEGYIATPFHAVKVIARGELKAKVDLKVQAASASVVAAIEKAGGSFEKVATPLRQSAKEAEEK